MNEPDVVLKSTIFSDGESDRNISTSVQLSGTFLSYGNSGKKKTPPSQTYRLWKGGDKTFRPFKFDGSESSHSWIRNCWVGCCHSTLRYKHLYCIAPPRDQSSYRLPDGSSTS